MSSLYLRAGLFAEGASDYCFLEPLVDRILDDVAASMFPGHYEVASSIGIDASPDAACGREARIPLAIHDRYHECTLFVIHTDADGDIAEARRTRVEPGIDAARAARSDRAITAVACIPVRAIEAWMLVDVEVFRTLLGRSVMPPLPADPETDLQPKLTLSRALRDCGRRRAVDRQLFTFFGERVRLSALRTLSAFRAFESDLRSAIQEVATTQGVPI